MFKREVRVGKRGSSWTTRCHTADWLERTAETLTRTLSPQHTDPAPLPLRSPTSVSSHRLAMTTLPVLRRAPMNYSVAFVYHWSVLQNPVQPTHEAIGHLSACWRLAERIAEGATGEPNARTFRARSERLKVVLTQGRFPRRAIPRRLHRHPRCSQ